jgi:hypothetical protein
MWPRLARSLANAAQYSNPLLRRDDSRKINSFAAPHLINGAQIRAKPGRRSARRSRFCRPSCYPAAMTVRHEWDAIYPPPPPKRPKRAPPRPRHRPKPKPQPREPQYSIEIELGRKDAAPARAPSRLQQLDDKISNAVMLALY